MENKTLQRLGEVMGEKYKLVKFLTKHKQGIVNH